MQAGLRWNRMRPMSDTEGIHEMIHVPLSYERFANGPDDFYKMVSEIVENPDLLISRMPYEKIVENIQLLLKAATDNPRFIRENMQFRMRVLEYQLSQIKSGNEQRDKTDAHIEAAQEAKPINKLNEDEMKHLMEKIAEFHKISEELSQVRINTAKLNLSHLISKPEISIDDVRLLSSAFMTMFSRDKNGFSHKSIFTSLCPLLTNKLAFDLFKNPYTYLPSFGITEEESKTIFEELYKSAESKTPNLEEIQKDLLIQYLESYFNSKGPAINCKFSNHWIYYNFIGPYLR